MLALLFFSNVWARDRTDIIWMSNGDRITGEIRQLEHGKLRLTTDSLGDVFIEWDDVEKIQSDYEFQFERTDGERITGTVAKTREQQEIKLVNEEQSVSFAHDNVVRISQMEDSFWERLRGSLSFGYSFSKGSDVATGNLNFRATHRTEERSFSLAGSTILTNDQEGHTTQSTDTKLSMTRFKANRWFNTYIMGFESNDEFHLKLRSGLGAGIGRYLIQTNTSEFSLVGGLLGAWEEKEEVDQNGDVIAVNDNSTLEGLLSAQYSRYIFDDPTVDLSIVLSAFPSISESGRTRAQLDVNLRWELMKDLFWDLKYYNKYDSEGSDSTSDHGVVTSIGYSF